MMHLFSANKKLLICLATIVLFFSLLISPTFASYYSSFTLSVDVGHPAGGGGTCKIPVNDITPPDDTIWRRLVTGQGRCPNLAWTDVNSFISFIQANDAKGGNFLNGNNTWGHHFSNYIPYLKKIYTLAQDPTINVNGTIRKAHGPLNPAFILAKWGYETDFAINNNTYFDGCTPAGSLGCGEKDQVTFGCLGWKDSKGLLIDFDDQLNCITNNVYDNWEYDYETGPKPRNMSVQSGLTCYVNDSLVFAYEKDAPTDCAYPKGTPPNCPNRPTFVDFYRSFMLGLAPINLKCSG